MTKELEKIVGETLYRSAMFGARMNRLDLPTEIKAVGRLEEKEFFTPAAVDILSGWGVRELENKLGGIGFGKRKAEKLRKGLDRLMEDRSDSVEMWFE